MLPNGFLLIKKNKNRNTFVTGKDIIYCKKICNYMQVNIIKPNPNILDVNNIPLPVSKLA